jgi:hypothetical protein
VLCGGGGPSASSPLLNDKPASLRHGVSHPAHRRSQITRAFNLDTTLTEPCTHNSLTNRVPSVMLSPHFVM